jgi:hypothetical protein
MTTDIDKSFIGRGWDFPPRFNQYSKSVDMVELEDDIVSSLGILLGTRPGERVMFPEYGCNLDELSFESLDTRIITLVVDKIETAILYFEPRIITEKVTISESEEINGVLLININFRVKSTNSRLNYVYPFYQNEGTDIPIIR